MLVEVLLLHRATRVAPLYMAYRCINAHQEKHDAAAITSCSRDTIKHFSGSYAIRGRAFVSLRRRRSLNVKHMTRPNVTTAGSPPSKTLFL